MKRLLFLFTLILVSCNNDEETRIFTVTTNAIPYKGGTVTLETTLETTGDYNLGDIAISYEYIKKEAQELNIDFDDHMIHMLIHGVYHILGFNHDNDKRACVMEKKEIKLLNKLNIKNPY